MTTRADAVTPPVSEALRRDLALVLPDVRGAQPTAVEAYARGTPIALDEAIVEAVKLIDASESAVICGLSMLTIEAVRQAVALSRKVAAPLVPWPSSGTFSGAAGPIYGATLGHVFGCDLAIEVGLGGMTDVHPIAAAVRRRVSQRLCLDGTAEDVSNLRAQLRDRGAAALAGHADRPVRRVAVLLPANAPAVIVRQWHELAGECQQQVRMCVFVLPEMTTTGNQRGALEVIAWQTGGLPATGAPDIAGADLLLELGLCSVDLDRRDGARRICVGTSRDGAAELSFVTPGLAPGLAARVIRCDGIVLWLCDDPATAPPDPCVDLLGRITAGIAGSS